MTKIKNNSTRGNILKVIFYLLLGVSIVSMYSNIVQYMLLQSAKNGETITMDVANANDMRQAVVSSINVLLLLLSSIFFLVWLYRAYDNLYKLGVYGLSCTPGWAIGYWFIPIVSLYKPYVVVNEVWEETQDHILPKNEKGNIERSSIVGLWWFLYIFNIICSYVVTIFLSGHSSIDGLMYLTGGLIFSNSITIILKIVTLVMINKLVQFEKKLWEYENDPMNKIQEGERVAPSSMDPPLA